jgi:hypothetical protein
MVRSTFSLKAPVFLLITLSLGEVASASDAVTPQKEALKDVELSSFVVDERGSSYRVDEQGRGRELGFFDVGFNWNMLMFHVGACHCSNEGRLPLLCPPHYCDLNHHGPHIPQEVYDYCGCDCEEGSTSCGHYENGSWVKDAESAVEDETAASDGTSSNGENKSVGGASVKSSWWMYIVGAAAVGMVAAAIIMRKRRNAETEDELNENASLSGAVSRRAALLSGGAAAAGAGAAMPQFLSVPSFRRNPSGLEVDASGAIIEQSPSNYMEMDNHVDSSQLPSGVEVSSDGNLEPYHMGSMA